MKKQPDPLACWSFDFTPEQVDTLRLTITFARDVISARATDDGGSYFAKRVTRGRLDDILSKINAVTG
jgi:hypothetical protein